MKDKTGRFLLVNPRYRELFELDEKEIIGKTVFDLFAKDRADVAHYWDQITLNGTPPLPRSYEHHRRDGSTAHYTVTKFAFTDATGSPSGVCMIVQDVSDYQRAEAELAEKSNLLETILNSVPSGISLRDTAGRYVFISQNAANDFGLDRSAILGQTQFEVAGESPVTRAIEGLFHRVVESGEAVFNAEFASNRIKGRTFSFSLSPVIDGAGRVDGVVTVAQDITESKRAETALKESEHGLAEAQRIGRIGHWRIDGDRGIMSMSKEAYRALGYDPGDDERTLEVIRAAVHPDDLKKLEETRTQAIANRKPYEFKYRITRPDGEVRVMAGEGIPEYDENGKLTSIFGVTQDVTEQNAVEEALRKSEARMSDFANSSADFYWQTDTDLRYNYLSHALETSIGKNTGALIGLTPDEAIGPVFDKTDAWKYISGQLQQRKPFRDVVFARQGPDEKDLIWIRASGQPFFDDSGEFQGFRGSSTDITKHRALEEQLIQSQKMETVGQLTGGVAHDFNNLLAVIMGNAELLIDMSVPDPISERHQSLTQTIVRTAERGAELTQQLLAYSRKQALSPKVVYLNDHITAMTSILTRSLGADIKIVQTGDADLWPCLVDPGQVENAVLNLALNARDAMPDGGNLSIETANAILDDDYAAAQADLTPGEYVTISITDTGTGMARDVLDHVFEPFFTTKGQGKGTGLGLSMVFGFVKQSDGHVTIYSEVGRGTTVKLYLPRAEDVAGMAADPVPLHPPTGRNECVLVVEDDADVRTLAVALLSDLGYRVLDAGDGAAALGILERERHIDLLFTDVILPGGMNGDAIALAAPRYQPNIKVMFMSGFTQDALIHQGKLGDDVVLLHKPFRLADLANKLRQALDGPLAADASIVE